MKKVVLSSSATMLVLWLAPSLVAEEVFTDSQWNQAATSAPAAAPGKTGEVVGKSLISIGLSLAFVLALAVFLGWLVKRLGVKRLVQARGRHLEIVDSVSLAFKRQVSLVRIGDQVVMVGVGEHEVTHLVTLPAGVLDQRPAGAELPAPATAPDAPAPPLDGTFRTLLGKALKG